MRREAQENVAKAHALQREARNPLTVRERHPAVVLLDAVHTLDVLHDDAKRALEDGDGDLSQEDWLRITNAAERAARTAKMVFEARADEALVRHVEDDAEVIGHVLNSALAALDLDAERGLWPGPRCVGS